MKYINEYFPMIKNGEITADQAVKELLENGSTYALEYFSPQTDADLPYWEMIDSKTYRDWKDEQKAKKEEKIKSQPQPKNVICDCGCITPVSLVMNTSKGSSCPDCYDDMSD